jgi:hypothetical protein
VKINALVDGELNWSFRTLPHMWAANGLLSTVDEESERKHVNNFMQHKLAVLLSIVILGSVAASSDVLACAGGRGGKHGGGFGGGHMSPIVNVKSEKAFGKEMIVTLRLVSLTNLRRESILINTDQIIKIKDDRAEHPGSNAVVYLENGFVAVSDTLDSIRNIVPQFIAFTGSDHRPLLINPDKVVLVRTAGNESPGSVSLIVLEVGFSAVMETIDGIKTALGRTADA